jgi:hypothetical protein
MSKLADILAVDPILTVVVTGALTLLAVVAIVALRMGRTPAQASAFEIPYSFGL